MWDLLVSIPDNCLSFYFDNCTMYSIVEWFCSHSNDFSCMSVLSCRSVTRKKNRKSTYTVICSSRNKIQRYNVNCNISWKK